MTMLNASNRYNRYNNGIIRGGTTDAFDRDIVDGRSIYNPSPLRALQGCYSRRYKRPFSALKLESTPTTSGREKLFHHLTRKVALARLFLSDFDELWIYISWRIQNTRHILFHLFSSKQQNLKLIYPTRVSGSIKETIKDFKLM